MNTIMIRGRRYRRPARPQRLRVWKTPRREHHKREPVLYTRLHLPEFSVFTMCWHEREGYSYARWVVYWDEDTLVRELGGADCDGEVSETDEFRIQRDGSWVRVSNEVHDAYARAAGV